MENEINYKNQNKQDVELTKEYIDTLLDAYVKGKLLPKSYFPSIEAIEEFERTQNYQIEIVLKCKLLRKIVVTIDKEEQKRAKEIKSLYVRLKELENQKEALVDEFGKEYHGLVLFDEKHENIIFPEGFKVSEKETQRLNEINEIYEQLDSLNSTTDYDKVEGRSK